MRRKKQLKKRNNTSIKNKKVTDPKKRTKLEKYILHCC